jgi:hypothetical protein
MFFLVSFSVICITQEQRSCQGTLRLTQNCGGIWSAVTPVTALAGSMRLYCGKRQSVTFLSVLATTAPAGVRFTQVARPLTRSGGLNL